MLQNELAFFYDDRTGNGELLSFSHHHVISEETIGEMERLEIDNSIYQSILQSN